MLQVVRETVDWCCEGCARVEPEDKSLCTAYAFPDSKCKSGVCPLSTHFVRVVETPKVQVRVGQQKQAKKS